MEWGKVRWRAEGGHGGHNGVRSMIDELGSSEFRRLKIGVGRPQDRQNTIDWVLGRLSDEQLAELAGPIYKEVEQRVETYLK